MPNIQVAELTIKGGTGLSTAEQAELVASIKALDWLRGWKGWLEEVQERVRSAWQERGYYKAAVEAKSRLLSSNASGDEYSVNVEINEGPQFRLGRIQFSPNGSDPQHQLRTFFALHDGDVLNVARIRDGLEALRQLYNSKGYINFVAMPDAQIDENHYSVSLDIDLDTGKQIRVSDSKILGLSPALAEKLIGDSRLRPGEIFNSQLLDLFFRQNKAVLPDGVTPEIDSTVKQDPQTGTVSILLDFRPCPPLSASEKF
jgi:outer membrane protein insertion porin family